MMMVIISDDDDGRDNVGYQYNGDGDGERWEYRMMEMGTEMEMVFIDEGRVMQNGFADHRHNKNMMTIIMNINFQKTKTVLDKAI